MAVAKLGDIDRRVRGSVTGQIVVYLAVVLTLMAIPVLVISNIRPLENRTYLYDCAFEGIFALSTVWALLLMRKGPYPQPMSSFGYTTKGIVTLTAIGAGIGLAIMSALMNLLRVLKVYDVMGINAHFSPWKSAVLFFFVAVAEETLFRGFIFNTIERKNGTTIALASTSIAFGLAHLIDPVPGVSTMEHVRAAIFIAFEVGLLLNAAFLLTRTIWLNIGIHWAWNFFQGPFYGAPVSGSPEISTYFISRFDGPFYATGGGFGPEASVYCLIIGTTVGLLMVVSAIRRGQWRPNPEFANVGVDSLNSEKL